MLRGVAVILTDLGSFNRLNRLVGRENTEDGSGKPTKIRLFDGARHLVF
jgi:hypothetical protein